MPIVSGNVSLYNETDGTGILPTPTIGAVGILASLDDLIAGRPAEGDVAVLIGETRGHLGQSALLAEAFGIEAGDAPPVDLAAERRNGEFLRANRKLIRAATDLSDGGLALAAFEMAEGAGLGLTLDAGDIGRRSSARIRRAIWWPARPRTLRRCMARRARRQVCRSRSSGVSAATRGHASARELAHRWPELSQLYRTAFAEAVELTAVALQAPGLRAYIWRGRPSEDAATMPMEARDIERPDPRQTLSAARRSQITRPCRATATTGAALK